MRSKTPAAPPKPESGCFLPGTLVRMADGAVKPIEDVRVGDLIISYDTARMIPIEAEVLEIEAPTRQDYYIMALVDWHDLRLADDHPLYIRRAGYEGWGAINPERTLASAGMAVEELRVGDEVLTYDGWVLLTAITHIAEQVQAYNLKRVSPGNTFFAGDVLAHNKG